MKIMILLALPLFLIACTSTIQSASISEAYKKFELQDYDRTLELITRAENTREATTEMKAEMIYLKAQTYEKLDQLRTANTLYEYLTVEHAGSQFGYLATTKMRVEK